MKRQLTLFDIQRNSESSENNNINVTKYPRINVIDDEVDDELKENSIGEKTYEVENTVETPPETDEIDDTAHGYSRDHGTGTVLVESLLHCIKTYLLVKNLIQNLRA